MRSLFKFIVLSTAFILSSCDHQEVSFEDKTNFATNQRLGLTRSSVKQEIEKSITPILSVSYQDYQKKGYIDMPFLESNAKNFRYNHNLWDVTSYSHFRSVQFSTPELNLSYIIQKSQQYLSSKQLVILKEFILAVTRRETLEPIYHEAEKSLSQSESKEMFLIMVSTEGMLEAFFELKRHESVDELRARPWRGWRREIEEFACNAATAGIGGVWTSMASGVAVAAGAGILASTGIGAVVGFVGAYALSRVAC